MCGSGGGRKGLARQFYCGNRPEDRRNVIPILLHGDPAFAGQGVVYETMQLAGVDDFHIGGTIPIDLPIYAGDEKEEEGAGGRRHLAVPKDGFFEFDIAVNGNITTYSRK